MKTQPFSVWNIKENCISHLQKLHLYRPAVHVPPCQEKSIIKLSRTEENSLILNDTKQFFVLFDIILSIYYTIDIIRYIILWNNLLLITFWMFRFKTFFTKIVKCKRKHSSLLLMFFAEIKNLVFEFYSPEHLNYWLKLNYSTAFHLVAMNTLGR